MHNHDSMPVVAVSRCLLGDPVRYDGKDKKSQKLIEEIAGLFSILPVCPEVEAGLSIPRPPVQLVKDGNGIIYVRGRDDQTVDITSQLHRFFRRFDEANTTLSGAILQNRSPSCGVGDTPLFSPSGSELNQDNGVFTTFIRSRHPDLPVSTPKQLNSDEAIQEFRDAVFRYIKRSTGSGSH
ncbi:MAG: DUF523 domain-containing protein [Gammaproteobacteria bacterium]|uniref:DUF523 domain-containing protein n=1 Tax=Candidatus Thiopontia autotrophica TaxID=2841688 RepID=A0A8J6P2X7_9GAMM|nr:DUF523 domain-containing protein [Candidatus Thiopontia autotrophica]MBL6969688.1 DUF523 domain-containing protein [Gammaproteobacteria bacterium]